MRAEPFIPSLQPQQTDRRPAFISPSHPPSQQEVLLIEGESVGAKQAAALSRDYRVVMLTEPAIAKQYLSKTPPALVVADIDSQSDGGVDICRTAKSLKTPVTVLMTTSEATSVPDVLVAGCDGILLKPFAANLLYARIGRLLRTRGEQLQVRAYRGDGASDVTSRLEPLATTNRTWPDTVCPSCRNGGAVSFEFSSHRRAWYACLGCKKVWLGKRQE